MKNNYLIVLFVFVGIFVFSCEPAPSEDSETATEENSTTEVTEVIEAANSAVPVIISFDEATLEKFAAAGISLKDIGMSVMLGAKEAKECCDNDAGQTCYGYNCKECNEWCASSGGEVDDDEEEDEDEGGTEEE